jgi:hypothetical protein
MVPRLRFGNFVTMSAELALHVRRVKSEKHEK